MKRLLWGTGLLVIVLLGLLFFNYYYYFPPHLPQSELIIEAQKQLDQELPACLPNYRDPYMQVSLQKSEVLDVRELEGKTYLVFKADIESTSAEEVYKGPYQAGAYILGIRQVEGGIGRISLKKGMEFTTDLMGGANPAECGQMPDGVFFAYCKDPQVEYVILELDDGQSIKATANNRVILTRLAKGKSVVTPRFYNKEGVEIDYSSGMKIAFVSQNEEYYRQYSNYPLNWWNMSATEVNLLTPDLVDAIWIFPDQQADVLQEEQVSKLSQLIKEGIPVIFVGMKDLKDIEVFKLEPGSIVNAEVPASEVEAVYLAKNLKGIIKGGIINLDDEEYSPVLMKTLSLRYHWDVTGNNWGKVADAPQPTAAPTSVVQSRGGF
ncbi:MAG: hypothetical protein ACOX6E_05995 [Syntrophomonadaceae bacterium]